MHHDPVEFGTSCRMADECPDRSFERGSTTTDSLRCCVRLIMQLREQSVDRGPPQLELRVEVIVDLGLVHTCACGDRPRGRSVETVCGELMCSGLEQDRAGDGGEVTAGHG